MWTDQRFLALRMGGHVLSRHFRYYVPDVSGQSTVQTPVVVRWVLIALFVLLCSLFLWLQFHCIFAAVGCCWMLDGLASWYYFGGLSFLSWSTWFGACWVTASLCYLLSSNRDDSFQKIKASLPFCRANCARTVCTCMCLLCFLSKNENNNGFGTIGLGFLFLTKSVWRIFILLLYFALFSLVVLV